MQSGSALNPWSMAYDPTEMAFKLGELLGIQTQCRKELISKLKEFTVEQIVTASRDLQNFLVWIHF